MQAKFQQANGEKVILSQSDERCMCAPGFHWEDHMLKQFMCDKLEMQKLDVT